MVTIAFEKATGSFSIPSISFSLYSFVLCILRHRALLPQDGSSMRTAKMHQD